MTRYILLAALFIFVATDAFSQRSAPRTLPAVIMGLSFTRGDFIYVLDKESKVPVRLVKGMDPNLSPSGRFLAYTISTGGSQNPDRTIRVMDLRTRTTSDFKSLSGFITYMPIWSPDETHYAFNILIDHIWHVAVMGLASGRWTAVTRSLPDKFGTYLSSWTPEGKTLLCQDLSTLYEVDLSGKIANKWSIEKIAGENGVSSSTRFTFSADRRYLIFDTSEAEESATVFLFNLLNNRLQRLTSKNVLAGQPIWLPGSDNFLYSSFRKMPRNNGIFDIYKSSIAGARPVLILQNAWNLSVATY